jgi:tyrosyl-tRNA synthetase
VAEKLGLQKPTSLHTPLIVGLVGASKMDATQYDENPDLSTQISFKMSKSIPESSILIHDDPETIRNKIRGAYCPPKGIKGNPILEISKYIVLPWEGSLEIDRPEKYGGRVDIVSYDELENQYRDGKIHPLDLKNAVAEELVKILEPVREEFEKRPSLLHKMEQLQVTR